MNLLSIGSIGLYEQIYHIAEMKGNGRETPFTFTVELGEKTITWAKTTLDYLPKLVVPDNGGVISLEFQSDDDAMLFKLTFAHLWQD
jgi:hypothetical protein